MRKMHNRPLKRYVLDAYRHTLKLRVNSKRCLDDLRRINALPCRVSHVPILSGVRTHDYDARKISCVGLRDSRIDKREGVEEFRKNRVVTLPMRFKRLRVERDNFVLILMGE